MYNNLRVVQMQQWNELLWVWLKTPWLFQQSVPRRWLVMEAMLNWWAWDSSWYGSVLTPVNISWWNDLDIWYQNWYSTSNWSNAYISTTYWLNLANDFTISTWVKLNVVNTNSNTILSRQWNNAAAWWWLDNYFILLHRQDAWCIVFQARNASNAQPFISEPNTSHIAISWTNTSNVWYHIIIDKIWTSMRIFLNNELNNEATLNQNFTSEVNRYVQFHSWLDVNWNRSNYWNNKCCLTRIYNVILTDLEKRKLYKEWLKILH